MLISISILPPVPGQNASGWEYFIRLWPVDRQVLLPAGGCHLSVGYYIAQRIIAASRVQDTDFYVAMLMPLMHMHSKYLCYLDTSLSHLRIGYPLPPISFLLSLFSVQSSRNCTFVDTVCILYTCSTCCDTSRCIGTGSSPYPCGCTRACRGQARISEGGCSRSSQEGRARRHRSCPSICMGQEDCRERSRRPRAG